MTRQPAEDAELEQLQRESFAYFIHEANPANGLVIDKTAAGWPASIAATGLASSADFGRFARAIDQNICGYALKGPYAYFRKRQDFQAPIDPPIK